MASQEGENAVGQILKKSLEGLLNQHMKVLEVMENQVNDVEQRVNSQDPTTSPSIEDTLRLAALMDALNSKLATCYQTLTSASGAEPTEESASSDLAMGTNIKSNENRRNKTATGCNVENENSAVAFNVLQAQMEALQQEASRKQKKQHHKIMSRLQELETKLFLMGENVKSQDQIDQRLTNMEAKVHLIKGMQLRNDETAKEANRQTSKLQKELQDNISHVEIQQTVLEAQLGEVRNMAEDLIKLRNILSQLHVNVTRKGDLAEKIHLLEEEMTKVQCEVLSPTHNINLPSLLTSLTDSNEEEIMPAFVAKAAGRETIIPKAKILFQQEIFNHWGSFDTNTSTFVAPTAGIYLFCTSINIDSPHKFGACICHNDTSVASFGSPAVKDLQSSTSVILSLSPGDKVWVEANAATNQNGVVIGGGYSNFIGCRLH